MPPLYPGPFTSPITPLSFCQLSCNLAGHGLKRIAGASLPRDHTAGCHLAVLPVHHTVAPTFHSLAISTNSLGGWPITSLNELLERGPPTFSKHITTDCHSTILLESQCAPRSHHYPNISAGSHIIWLGIGLKKPPE